MLVPDKYRKTNDQLYARYPRSGLYFNNGATNPLWTVAWYAQNIEVSRDGECIAAQGSFPFVDDDRWTLALVFYRKGREVKQYQISELITNVDILQLGERRRYWFESWQFDDTRNLLSVEMADGFNPPPAGTLNIKVGITNTGGTYMFDISTGLMVTNLPAPIFAQASNTCNIMPPQSMELCLQRINGRKSVTINEVSFNIGEQKAMTDANGETKYSLRCEHIGSTSVVITVVVSPTNQVTKVLELDKPLRIIP